MGPEVAEAIAALTDRPQILVGHSLGGMTGAWIAAHRPDLVATFLLVDITPGIERDGGPAVLRAFYEKVEFDSRAEVEAWATGFGMGGSPAALTRGVFHNTRIRPDGVVEWKHHFARLASTALATLDQDTAPVLGETSWDNLSATTAPLTLARGDHGFVSDAAAMRFRERLPHATVIDLAGGHNLQEDDPAALAAVIRSLVIS